MRSRTLETSSDISRALVSIAACEADSRRLIELRAAFRECAAGASDHRERGAQIMRYRSQQSIAQAFPFRRETGGFGRFRKSRALERETDLARECFEQVTLFGQQHAPGLLGSTASTPSAPLL